MKKMIAKSLTALVLLSSVVMADATADFISGTISMASSQTVPTNLTSLEREWNASMKHENAASKLLLEATGLKEESEVYFATIAELEGKEDLSRSEKGELEAANEGVAELLTNANELDAEKSDLVTEALGHATIALVKNTMITLGGDDVVSSIKGGGRSPAVLADTRSATAIISAAPDKGSSQKSLITSIVGIMQTNSLPIPSPEDATSGIERM